jgi:hypothetical protein
VEGFGINNINPDPSGSYANEKTLISGVKAKPILMVTNVTIEIGRKSLPMGLNNPLH